MDAPGDARSRFPTRSTTGSTGSSCSGAAETLGTKLVGEAGGPDVDIERDPYPTDHRGVVSTFRVEPANPAPFAAVGGAPRLHRARI